jgi:hypothetical protein
MVVKFKFKDVSERERIELVEVKEKPCLLSLLMDKKMLTKIIMKYQRTDEFLTEVKDVD